MVKNAVRDLVQAVCLVKKGLALFVIPLIALFVALSTAALLHYKIPVAIFMHSTYEERYPDRIKLHVSGLKIRDGCRPIADSFTGYVHPADGYWREIKNFSFENDPTPNNSKGFGWNSFEVWVWDITNYNVLDLSDVRMVMQHKCDDVIIVSVYDFALD